MRSGDRIGPYVVVDQLGAGGMGEVYRARDTRLGRQVALKRLSNRDLATADARRRLLREARAAAALSHPNIATIFDVLDTPDGLVIVMEYVPGETLGARLARGALPVPEALRIASQIADALIEAHAHGVIHRDLKPANLHLTPDGKVKILDFGIARSAAASVSDSHSDDSHTEAGLIVGTPGYMAPEQLAGGPADERTDVHGAGLLLFEMLTGRRAFAASDFLGAALAVFDGPVPRVSHLAPSVPEDVSALVARAMATQPEDRFASATELSLEINAVAQRLVNAATKAWIPDTRWPIRTGALSRSAARARRHPVAAAGGALLLVVAAFAGMRLLLPLWSPPVSAHASVVGVLPFRNDTGEPANDPVVLGLSEAVSRRLAGVSPLRVLPLDETREVARDTQDPRKAARSLGAGFVVEGTMDRRGDTLNVSVALVGHDGRRRPAGHYSGDSSRIFDLHRRVADGLVAALGEEGVVRGPAAAEPSPPTTSQEAFADYAQARVFLERPDVPGNLDHAVRLFESAIARDSRFALAHAGLGEACWAQYRETNDPAWTARATAAILDALRIDPAQPEVRMSLAVMYRGLGRTDEAIDELRRVMELQPRNDNPRRVLAGILIDRGEWDAAIGELQHAIELRPSYWRNHSELGFAHFRAGRFDEAARAYERVTELQPDSARGFHMLGTVLQSAGRTDDALTQYERANALRSSASTLSNIGTLHYWRGDYAAAASAYERAIAEASSSPSNEPEPGLFVNLGDALARLGRRTEAAQQYRRAIDSVEKLLAVSAKDPFNLALLATSHAKLGQREAAERSIAAALALNPNDPEVLYARAVVHALAGERSGACRALTDALTRGASREIVRHADELRALKGCPAYDGAVRGS